MTNLKTRKTRKTVTVREQQVHSQRDNFTREMHSIETEGVGDADRHRRLVTGRLVQEDPEVITSSDVGAEIDEEEDVADSGSSFSLEECINEFRARRIRRISTHSRDVAAADEMDAGVKTKQVIDSAEEDLINQNRTNKEQERKCKPCKNGFCYCFTSDSGEGGCGITTGMLARGLHVRHSKRNRKSECSQATSAHPHRQHVGICDEKRRQSAPPNLKSENCHFDHQLKQEKEQHHLQSQAPTQRSKFSLMHPTTARGDMTAISCLNATTEDAPLIHIIQELHNNCVISEVRVNKDKVQKQQQQRRSKSLTARTEFSVKKSPHFQLDLGQSTGSSRSAKESPEQHSPSAPPIEEISEIESSDKGGPYAIPLDACKKSTKCRQKYGGRLLKKRLSYTHNQFKHRNFDEPPPKPPRCSVNVVDQSSVGTSISTSPSVREAERIIDAFLKQRGIEVPGENKSHQIDEKRSGFEKENHRDEVTKRGQRKSYPLTDAKRQGVYYQSPLPSCPSLSDIERIDTKRSNYDKNLNYTSGKSIKSVTIGWNEPKINDMLNYDRNANRKEFKSQAIQAEPQAIGWQAPPKIDLDTVDGSMRRNLATNIENKNTPVKTEIFGDSQKFIWGEQFRNFSPWTRKSTGKGKPNGNFKSNLKSTSSSFFKNSKKKILRLVSPQKEKKARNITLRSVGVQTSLIESRTFEDHAMLQSPPGSYQSAAIPSPSQQSSNFTNSQEKQQQFDFTRTVQSPPKKAPRVSQRKLDFPAYDTGGHHDDGITMTKTYHSYQADLDQDVTLSRMGYILSKIRAKLEASDEHAERTFQEIERRERNAREFDSRDSHEIHQRRERPVVHRNIEQFRPTRNHEHEPIYSEIEEDSILISGSPQRDNKTSSNSILVHQEAVPVYAKVNKTPRLQTTGQQPTALGKFLHESLKNKSAMMLAALPSLPPLPEPPCSDAASYSTPLDSSPEISSRHPHHTTTLPHCLSLNNIRVQEHHSPPKKNRNLSKSDLSLHRSEIFLENLCRSEIIVEDGEMDRLVKVNNDNHTQSYVSLPSEDIVERINTRHDQDILNVSATSSQIHNDVVSYELPNESDIDSNTGESQMGLSVISGPQVHNQSTPKKSFENQSFVTKVELFVDSY